MTFEGAMNAAIVQLAEATASESVLAPFDSRDKMMIAQMWLQVASLYLQHDSRPKLSGVEAGFQQHTMSQQSPNMPTTNLYRCEACKNTFHHECKEQTS